MISKNQEKRPAASSFISIALLIDVISLAIIIPVFPKLIKGLIHGDISEASKISGLLLVAYTMMQFLCAP